MADFMRFIWRARHGMGWAGSDLLRAYAENRETAMEVVLKADSFAYYILRFMRELAHTARAVGYEEQVEKGRPKERTLKSVRNDNGVEIGTVVWTGTATKLLELLPADETARKQRWWPSGENRRKGALRQAQTPLAYQGIDIDTAMKGRRCGRLMKIEADIGRLLDGPTRTRKTLTRKTIDPAPSSLVGPLWPLISAVDRMT